LNMISDIDMEFPTKPEADNVKVSNSTTFSAYTNTLSPMSPKKTGSIKRKHSQSQKTTISNYPSVGELLWDNGKMFSDVRLSFEDREGLAIRAGIPSELRLHSIVLFQSQFFKEQLSQTSSNISSLPKSNMRKEKQIIVKLPYRVNEEDMVNFYCTLKLMYTKKWDSELANNLAKGVGCLSVCWEIGFHEGIEACWKWLVRKCSRDRNKEMMKKLIDAYPRLHEKFTHQVDLVNNSLTELFSDTSLQRAPSLTKSSSKKAPTLPRRSMRRENRPKATRRIAKTGESEQTLLAPLLKSDSDTSTSTSTNSSISLKVSSISLKDSSTSLNTSLASIKASSTSLGTQYENLPLEAREDNRCFPFLEHFISIFESINQLGKVKLISSKECLDYALRMLNVIKIEHSHFHMLHNTSNQRNRLGEELSSQPIVLHESLDEPLTILLKEILLPIEQKHLCDYLWAPSNVSNLMHLREIRSDNVNLMEEDEFEEFEQVMRETSLVKGSRVSQVEHMIVGEKMAKAIREVLNKNSYNFI
ncbi:11020_t:CDS:2, partial [Racocetra fulgida]